MRIGNIENVLFVSLIEFRFFWVKLMRFLHLKTRRHIFKTQFIKRWGYTFIFFLVGVINDFLGLVCFYEITSEGSSLKVKSLLQGQL